MAVDIDKMTNVLVVYNTEDAEEVEVRLRMEKIVCARKKIGSGKHGNFLLAMNNFGEEIYVNPEEETAARAVIEDWRRQFFPYEDALPLPLRLLYYKLPIHLSFYQYLLPFFFSCHPALTNRRFGNSSEFPNKQKTGNCILQFPVQKLPTGIEPVTSSLPMRCATYCATAACSVISVITDLIK